MTVFSSRGQSVTREMFLYWSYSNILWLPAWLQMINAAARSQTTRTSSQMDDELSAADYKRGTGGMRRREKKEKVLWMTHPLRLPLRYDASAVGYLQQAQTAALPSNMIISRAGLSLCDCLTSSEGKKINSTTSVILCRGLKTYITWNTQGWFSLQINMF